MKLFTTLLFTCSALFAGVFDFDTIESDFKQTITNEENSKIIYKGTLYATSQSKALWIYKNPINKKIYFSQKRVIILEPELEQAIITTLQNTPNLTKILKSAEKVDEKSYKAVYEETSYTIHVDNQKIKSISYSDKLDNRITIELYNQTLNSTLKSTLFEATIPNDFDIITQ